MLIAWSMPMGSSVWAQNSAPPATPQANESQSKTAKAVEGDATKISEAVLIEEQRRTFAVSMLMSLTDEARKYRDITLRPRVLARAADTLWDADSDTAKTQFRRAWEAAEKADAEDADGGGATTKTKNAPPAMVIALRKMTGRDLRSEVLTLAARRDRALGEEFLAKLTADMNRESAETTSDASGPGTNDSWSTSQAVSKRLILARKLLDDGQVERALEFAAPVLNQVNEKTISFLSALRLKRPQLADQRFLLLLTGAELDPSSDANTVSGLSSYAFTPGLYLTFSPEGGVRWTPAEEKISPPNLPAEVRNRFFQTAANILLRPLPRPDQDFTSAGRTGKYMVMKRLLPLFEQYAPDTAVALRSQLAALAGERINSVVRDENSLMTQGIQLEISSGDVLEKMQDRLDRAKTSRERDAIYDDAAATLAGQGDARAQDLADKIDNPDRRAMVRGYVDLSLVHFAIRKKDAAVVARLAKTGVLGHPQRAWAYTQAARLFVTADRPRALDLLEEALAEARRIDADDPNRARALISAATSFHSADSARAWEIMGEAVKAANGTEEFSGEDSGLHVGLATRSGLKLTGIDGSEFSLPKVIRLLTKEDLIRATDLAKNFKNDAPRAVAILVIAGSVFEKPEAQPATEVRSRQ
jgi:hypothetical protein